MTKPRVETDSFGPIEVPDEHLWGAQTQRSLLYFAIGADHLPYELIMALVRVKRAAALANHELDLLDADIANAIVVAFGHAVSAIGAREERAMCVCYPHDAATARVSGQ